MKEFRDFNLSGGRDGFAHDSSTKEFERHSRSLDQDFSRTLLSAIEWRAHLSPETEAFDARRQQDLAEQAQWDTFAHDNTIPRC